MRFGVEMPFGANVDWLFAPASAEIRFLAALSSGLIHCRQASRVTANDRIRPPAWSSTRDWFGDISRPRHERVGIVAGRGEQLRGRRAVAWLRLSGSSRDPTAGETAAQSRKEQCVDFGDALLPLVRSSGDGGTSAQFCIRWQGGRDRASVWSAWGRVDIDLAASARHAR